MQKLSAVIITYNEEKNISRCIESVRDVADEVIIVDSFSTDKTKEICLRYDVQFFERAWHGYGEQKNWGNEHASYDYILSVDADEFLSNELKKSILWAKEHGTYDAYRFNRLNIYCGQKIRYGCWYPDTKLRIWNKHMGSWDNTTVHEVVRLDSSTKIKHLKGNLNHETYNSIDQHVKQIANYSDLWLQQTLRDGKRCSLFKLITVTPFRFFRDYILKLGVLDGKYGLIVNGLIAYESFLKYSKLYQHTRLLPPSERKDTNQPTEEKNKRPVN